MRTIIQGNPISTSLLLIRNRDLYQATSCPAPGWSRGVTKEIFKVCLFLIGGKSLYNIVLVSAIHQHESAIGVRMSPPSHLPTESEK